MFDALVRKIALSIESFVDSEGNLNVSEYLDSVYSSSSSSTDGSIEKLLDTVDTHWYVILLITFVVSLLIQFSAKAVFRSYSHKFSKKMLSGWEAAKAMLTYNCVYGVEVVNISGELTDHFDPQMNEIRLSESVYYNSSVAAIGIACHEAGHAIQHAYGSSVAKVRNVISGVCDILWEVFLLLTIFGAVWQSWELSYITIYVTVIVYSATVIFKILTLPIEFDASRRALNAMESANILDEEEIIFARRVLVACALTYVSSVVMSVLYLLKFIASLRKR
jgi:Zn-dependent membrane protease YugP